MLIRVKNNITGKIMKKTFEIYMWKANKKNNAELGCKKFNESFKVGLRNIDQKTGIYESSLKPKRIVVSTCNLKKASQKILQVRIDTMNFRCK